MYEGTVAREQDAKAVDQLKEAGVQFYEVASQVRAVANTSIDRASCRGTAFGWIAKD